MHFKLPSQESYILAPLSPTSVYHLRAACAKIEHEETSGDESELKTYVEKVWQHPTPNLEVTDRPGGERWRSKIYSLPRASLGDTSQDLAVID
jgi:hypothetical protein